METSDSTQRHRGAQPDNTNGLKHGFYSKNFRIREIRDLEKLESMNFREEIEVLRIYMRRILEKSKPDLSLEEDLIILRLLSLATASISRLTRTQLLVPESDPIEQALSLALDQLGLGKNSDPDKPHNLTFNNPPETPYR